MKRLEIYKLSSDVRVIMCCMVPLRVWSRGQSMTSLAILQALFRLDPALWSKQLLNDPVLLSHPKPTCYHFLFFYPAICATNITEENWQRGVDFNSTAKKEDKKNQNSKRSLVN